MSSESRASSCFRLLDLALDQAVVEECPERDQASDRASGNLSRRPCSSRYAIDQCNQVEDEYETVDRSDDPGCDRKTRQMPQRHRYRNEDQQSASLEKSDEA